MSAQPPSTLTLRVVRRNGEPVAPGLARTFDARGGTIGRAPQNDWCLPDDTRVLSAHHATVYAETGRFQLIDCSSNGVYLNDDDQPLGAQRIADLKDGDRLLLGDYEMAVELGRDATPPARMADAIDPLPLRSGAAGTSSKPVVATSPSGTERREPSWGEFGRAPQASRLVDREPVVDPLQLLAAVPPPVSRRAATARDDAPMLATAFRPPAPAKPVPDDWLDVAPAVSAAAASPAAASRADASASAAAALQQAKDALRDALAAIERAQSLQAAVPVANPEEARDGLA